MLDEPTNHLDTDGTNWLNEWLKSFSGAVLFVSHDRNFLDQNAQHILHITDGRASLYPGNYSSFLILKDAKERQEQLQLESNKKKIAKLEEEIQRFRAWGSVKKIRQAKSREKVLAKLEPQKDRPKLKNFHLDFTSVQSRGKLIEVVDLTLKAGERTLAKDISFSLSHGQKIALIGKNGCGKTTLLKALLDQTPSAQGQILRRYNNAGYYSQDICFNDESRTLTEEISTEVTCSPREARGLLARFLFPSDSHLKQIFQLSPGEKARLKLMALATGNYDLLVLDEPTNHLDLPGIEALEQALKEFPGAILTVSHDHRFISSFCQESLIFNAGFIQRQWN